MGKLKRVARLGLTKRKEYDMLLAGMIHGIGYSPYGNPPPPPPSTGYSPYGNPPPPPSPPRSRCPPVPPTGCCNQPPPSTYYSPPYPYFYTPPYPYSTLGGGESGGG
ncbi:hypothetical protein F2Q69_00019514 [Brassica cretica]|uniref:Uncharacterized protein n=1 Tax=Brassica cretica TaxID=69181 RepID=A0A8S9QAP4_BRACR|nr:hypothetical protein F2Q69_00019514 [Brassica cretica]